MFEMFTGKPPFVAPTAAEMLFAHLEEEPPRHHRTGARLSGAGWKTRAASCSRRTRKSAIYDALALQVALDEVVEKVAASKSVAQQTVAGGGNGATVKDEPRSARPSPAKKKKKKRKRVPFTSGPRFWSVVWPW